VIAIAATTMYLSGTKGNPKSPESAINSSSDQNFNSTGWEDKVIVQVGDVGSSAGYTTSNSSLPVDVTHITRLQANGSNLTQVTQIQPMWSKGELKNQYLKYRDSNGEDVMDESRPYLHRDALGYSEAVCDSGTGSTNNSNNNVIYMKIYAPVPLVGAIKQGTPNPIYVKYNLDGIRPVAVNETASSSNNIKTYNIIFSSFYNAEVKLPGSAVVLSNTIQKCTLQQFRPELFPSDRVLVYNTIFSLKD
jgi:hypothetical protein